MPDISCTPNLEKLDLHGCKKLDRIPDISNKNTGLREIYLEGTAIKELPTSIGNLQSLEVLHLRNCKKLTTLPPSIYMLQNLENLCLSGCSKLTKFPKVEEDLSDSHTKAGFPRLYSLNLGWCHLSEVEFLENFSCFPRLQYLNLSGNTFTNLPSCEQLYSLTILDVSNCQKLQEISKMPEKLRMLEANNCESLSRIPSNIRIVRVHSCLELARNGMSMNDWLRPEEFHHQTKCQIVLPGGEMPKWLLPNEEGYVSFTASKDLYDKFLRVAFCVVFRSEKERSLTLSIETFINGRRRERHSYNVKSFNLDHVWLYYTTPTNLWGVHNFGPNEWSIFHIRVTLPSFLDKRVIVKKFGFRLICKSLENDLEVLLQDDQLLDSALLYEVGYGDSQMSTEEDSPGELVHNGLNIADFSIEKFRYSSIGPLYRNVRPGGEMPEEFFLVEHDTISFIASQDVYDGCIGLALCVVFGVEDGTREVSFDIVPHVDGQRRNVLSGIIGSFDSDHTWFQFLEPNLLWGLLEGAVDFSHFKESCLRFSLTVKVLGGTLKKLGYLMSCKQQEFDLKVVLKGNQFVNLASFCEDYFQEGTYGEILAKECLKFRSDQVKASNSEAD
ncbi:uncharacterized protein LOC115727492 [Rhodamnia argentea]|uniref:Uncharacterized protein LOC115727492 n=1 Tax=Rhodamnia argentea TaxID=178133 RepID=A0A8B8MU44_9MYRT|nr:uncharacterized protein LOC115727492 [Rhodamnia argentea]